jgi:hypothetical protein
MLLWVRFLFCFGLGLVCVGLGCGSLGWVYVGLGYVVLVWITLSLATLLCGLPLEGLS